MLKIKATRKKAFKVIFVITSFVMGLTISCKKELLITKQDNSNDWAKEYYQQKLQNNAPQNINIHSKATYSTLESKLKQTNIISPMWELMSSGETSTYSFVEVPIQYSNKITSVLKTQGTSLTSNEKLSLARASFDRMIIYKDGAGNISEQIVTFMPDFDYLKKRNGNITHNNVNGIDAEFNGYLAYRGWGGQQLYLERIENGMLVKTYGNGDKVINRVRRPASLSGDTEVMRAPIGGGPDENCHTTEYDDYILYCWEQFSQLECQLTWVGDHEETYCSTGGGPTTPDPPTQEPETPLTDAQFLQEIDKTNLSECMKKLIDSITGTNSRIPSLIRKFSGTTPGFNWVLKAGSLPASMNGATSYQSSTKSVVSTFDNSKFTAASDLAVVRTMLHESVHAYLVVYFKLDPAMANAEYKEMVKQYMAIEDPDLNLIQHNEIVRSFVEDIAVALQEYGDRQGYQFSSELEKKRYYNDLSWGGLHETPAFLEKSSSEKQRILNTNSVEQTGVNMDGNTVTKKGKHAGC